MNTTQKLACATAQGQSFAGLMTQFCTFWVAERLYGVEILMVKEITSETCFTPIHHAPKEVNGYLNIRGQINLVLDLRLLLGFEERVPDASSRVVLFKPEVGEHFGVLVDRIGDVVATDNSLIEWRNQSQSKDASQSEGGIALETGVCKLERSLLVLLDPVKALSAIQERLAS